MAAAAAERDDFERTDLIGYGDFFDNYLSQNQLCVFASAVTSSWQSRQDWVTSDGRPDFGFLAEHFGDATVPVADCGQEYFSSHCKEDMKLKEFLGYWKKKGSTNNNDSHCLYLKDWHFCKFFPEYMAYKTPIYFTSDWLNEFWDQRIDVSDDYRFVYMGPKGSWTPFHVDVFCSYSWSANICGRKKWIIYPPGQERFLQDRLGNLPYDITSVEMNDKTKYPEFSKASKPIIVIQEEGEVMFMPSGWHHQVVNLEDTISINHNWINGCGIRRMWSHLQRELRKVQLSIEDCKDMENWNEHCQVILKASCGMDYAEFLEFLCIVAAPRIELLHRAMSCQTKGAPLENDSFDADGRKVQAGKSPSTQKNVQVMRGMSSSETPLEYATRERLSRSFLEWLQSCTDMGNTEQHTFVEYCRLDLLRVSERLCELEEDECFVPGLISEASAVKLKQVFQRIQDALCDAEKFWGPLDGFCVACPVP